jgi:hypothetical protein
MNSAVMGQITLEPSTVRTGRQELAVTKTVSVTSIKTESYIQRITTTVPTTITRTQVSTSTIRQTTTVERTVTKACAPNAPCPTITSTATACGSCLIPVCTRTEVLTRPCGCSGALPTAVVSFPCNRADSCEKIGCKTVYDIKTAAC